MILLWNHQGGGSTAVPPVVNVLDTALERISALHTMLPFRHIGVNADSTGFRVGKRQGAALMYGGNWVLTYGWGLEAGKLVDGAEV